jgi:protocatechuate 3,4-dioxygenase beta subunit
MKRTVLTRRDLVTTCIGNGLLLGGISLSGKQVLAAWEKGESAAMKPTATEQLGPFYKKGAPNLATLRRPGDAGFPLRVTGQVLDTRGNRVADATVDVWQTNAAGAYDLAGYRYRAKLGTGTTSQYQVETVMPGRYDLRPVQHIHYRVTAPGHKTLITQVYFATDPIFEGDPAKTFAKSKLVDNLELVRPVTLQQQAGGVLATITFDIVLERA